MTRPRLATYSISGAARYGAVVDGGIVDLSARFGDDYPTLREVIAAGALTKLAEDAAKCAPDHALDAITWLPPIPAPEKIICIGVNYPDRNAEYKDGQDAPKYPSMFMRTPRSFVGHDTPLVRPRASQQLDYEGEVVLVIGKPGRHIPESAALDHLDALRIRGADGLVKTDGTRAVDEPRLWLVGYGEWCGAASATLIGVMRSARDAVQGIARYLPSKAGPSASTAAR